MCSRQRVKDTRLNAYTIFNKNYFFNPLIFGNFANSQCSTRFPGNTGTSMASDPYAMNWYRNNMPRKRINTDRDDAQGAALVQRKICKWNELHTEKLMPQKWPTYREKYAQKTALVQRKIWETIYTYRKYAKNHHWYLI